MSNNKEINPIDLFKEIHPIDLLKKYQPNIAEEHPEIYINSLEEMLRLYYDAWKGRCADISSLLAAREDDLHNAFSDGVQYAENQEEKV